MFNSVYNGNMEIGAIAKTRVLVLVGLVAASGALLAGCTTDHPVANVATVNKSLASEVTNADIAACFAFDGYLKTPTKKLVTTMMVSGVEGGVRSVRLAALDLLKASAASDMSRIDSALLQLASACNSIDLGPSFPWNLPA